MTLDEAQSLAQLDFSADGALQTLHLPLSDDRQSGRRRRIAATVLSCLVNALVIFAIIITLPPPAIPIPKPIAVRIVPPPAKPPVRRAQRAAPKPPAPKPPPPKQSAAPHQEGRLASVTMGDPNAPKTATQGSESPAAGQVMPEEGSNQPVRKESAPVVEKERPNLDVARKPSQHRGGSRVRAIMAPPHNSRHYAEIPGPDATQDEYFTYFSHLFTACITPEMRARIQQLGQIPGVCFNVRRSGYITSAYVDPASGDPVLDDELTHLPDCLGQVARIPDHIDVVDGLLTICAIRRVPPGETPVPSIGSQIEDFNDRP